MDTATRRVFIVNSPRSGSTWLLWLLAHHPEIVGFEQSALFLMLKPLEEWFRDEWSGPRYGKGIIAIDPKLEDESPRVGPTRLDLGEVLSTDLFYDAFRTLAETAYQRILATKPGARVVAEQTPEHLDCADLILRIFPDAYFVHLVRDPRAVFSSRLASNESWAAGGFGSGCGAFAATWRRDVATGRAIREKTDRYREVRYESLLESGPRALADLHRFLGLDTDLDACEEALRRCSIDRMRKNAAAPAGFFRRGEATGWRSELSGRQVRVLEYLLGDLLDQLSYPRVYASAHRPWSLAAEERARAALRWTLGGSRRDFLRRIRNAIDVGA